MTTSVRHAALSVTGLSLLGSILGFARESFIAYRFGASHVTDAFYLAAIIPEVLAGWLSYTFTNALIPSLKKEIKYSLNSARQLASISVLYVFVMMAILVALVLLCRNPLVNMFAPSVTSEEHTEIIRLLTIMAFGIFANGLSGIMWGIHNAYESFTFPALIGVAYNLAVLTISILLSNKFGLQALAVGYLCGVYFRLSIQVIPLLFRHQLGCPQTWWHPALTIVLTSMGPIFLSIGVGTLNVIIDRALASRLPGGDLTNLNFASKVGLLPGTILGGALATTLYPRFVSFHIDSNRKEGMKLLDRVIRLSVFSGVVIGIIFVLYANDIIRVLFEHGAFQARDVVVSSYPLMLYGLFMVFYISSPVISHYFFAQSKNSLVLRSSAISVGVNILMSVMLVSPLGIDGLALSNAVSQLVYVCLQLLHIRKELNFDKGWLRRSIWNGLIPSISFGLPCTGFAVIFIERTKYPPYWGLPHLMLGFLVGLFGLAIFMFFSRKLFMSRSALYSVKEILSFKFQD